MKMLSRLMCVLVLSVLPVLPSMAADRQFVVVTPDPKAMSIADRKMVLKGVGTVMVESEQGTEVSVLDGRNQRLIVQFENHGHTATFLDGTSDGTLAQARDTDFDDARRLTA